MSKPSVPLENTITILLFAIVGALYWAMRGSDGYGGITGAVLPGMMWGLVWYYLASMRGREESWIVPACTIGFGAGGFNGYGQFISWSAGVFHIKYPELTKAISPSLGYIWLFICGFGWGGVGGHLVAFFVEKERKIPATLIRCLCFPVGAVVGWLIVARRPDLFMPFYSKELYDPAFCTDCKRNLEIMPIAGAFVGMTLLASLYDVFRRRLRSLITVAITAIGFGAVFSGAVPFQHFGKYAPGFDWWKVWEMTIGTVGGAVIGIVYLFNKDRMEPAKPVSRFIAVNFFIFLIVNWAAFGCLGVLWEHLNLPPNHLSMKLAFASVFMLTLALLVFSYEGGEGVGRVISPKTKIAIANLLLSVMACIVISPNKNLLMTYILLSFVIFTLIAVAGRRRLESRER